MSKRIALTYLLLCLALAAGAQGVCIIDSINAVGTITIIQPGAMLPLVSRPDVAAPSEGDTAPVRTDVPAARTGYRVLVFDDNNPRTAHTQASTRQGQVQTAFPQWRAYVSFNSPYWQVRVGDFLTRVEAEAAMGEIREAFPWATPYLRIVRERINHHE